MNGERIKLARKKTGLSLRALADKMNGKVSAQAIGKYERDEMVPSSDVLLALIKALDVTLPYLTAPRAVELGEVEFRAKASSSAKDRAEVETAVLEAVERYLQIEEMLYRIKLPLCERVVHGSHEGRNAAMPPYSPKRRLSLKQPCCTPSEAHVAFAATLDPPGEFPRAVKGRLDDVGRAERFAERRRDCQSDQ